MRRGESSFDATVGTVLGWASVAVGVTELAAPQMVERALGLREGEMTGVLRVLGVREVMHGVDLLSHRDPTPGVWSRVAGDVLDSAVLALAAKKSAQKSGVAGVFAAVAPLVLADMVLAPMLNAKNGGIAKRLTSLLA